MGGSGAASTAARMSRDVLDVGEVQLGARADDEKPVGDRHARGGARGDVADHLEADAAHVVEQREDADEDGHEDAVERAHRGDPGRGQDVRMPSRR